MSYNPGQGHHVGPRVPSGIAFFGTSATDPVYRADSGFFVEADAVTKYLKADNLKVNDGGNIGSVDTADAITIALAGDVSFGYDVSIAGDLTVNGTTTTVNSTVVTIEDPIIILGSGSPSINDEKDRGVSFNWHDGSSAKTGFFGFDESSGKFTFVPDATIAGEVVSGTAGTIVAGTFEGNLTGNASTATTLQNTRTFSATGEVTATAQNFNGSQNVQLSMVLDESAISNQSEITDLDDTGTDYLLIWDDTDDDLKKISAVNFLSDLGGMTSFDISGGGGTQTVNDGETITFASGATVFNVVSATNTVTSYLNTNSVSEDYLTASVAGDGLTGGNGSALAVGAGDGITVNANDVALASTTAGNGLGFSAGVLSVGAGSLIDVAADTVSVDLTEAAGATIADGDYLIFLDGGATGAASKGSTADLTTLMAGEGLVTDGSELDVNVDNSTLEVATDVVQVKDAGITEVKRSRTVATPNATSSITTDIVLATGGVAGITLTMPAAAGGKIVIVKKIDAGAGTVTILRNSSDTIDGSVQKILYSQYESMTFVSDGSNWYIV
jgi:hypothetical protein